MKEFNDKVYDTRDQNGKVKTGLRNFSTNPMKKGYGSSNHGHLFSEAPYQGTPYDFPRELETVRPLLSQKEKAEHRAGIPLPFVGTSTTKGVFTPDYEIAMNEINDPYQPKKLEKSSTTHFGPWRGTNPSKKGYNKTFQRFPQYIEEGEKPARPVSH